MSKAKLFNQLIRELEKGKQEKPALENDNHQQNRKSGAAILDEISGNTPNPLMFHQSHNSHGDWGKHWAHGGYTEKEPVDPSEENTKPVNKI